MTNIFLWQSGLETCFHTDCLHSNYHRFDQKVFFYFATGLEKKTSSVYIFVWWSGLKTWFFADCLCSNYQMLKQKVFFVLWPSLKMFYSVYYESQVCSKYFVWWLGLKTLYHRDYWLYPTMYTCCTSIIHLFAVHLNRPTSLMVRLKNKVLWGLVTAVIHLK